MPSISYGITACNESKELQKLLSCLAEHLREEDDIVVQLDQENYTKEVQKVVNKAISDDHYFNRLHLEWYPLRKDFAQFKNNLKSKCLAEYTFFIDADEYPSKHLLQFLPEILALNPDVDMYVVPRVNTVHGITPEHIRKWNWHIDDYGRINFPDYQTRIIKNTGEVRWEGKVHEKIVGYRTMTMLPADENFALYHPKEITRQERQNQYYNTIT